MKKKTVVFPVEEIKQRISEEEVKRPFKRNPDALSVVVMAKMVSIEEDCIDVTHDFTNAHFIHKDIRSQIHRFSKDTTRFINPLLSKYYSSSPSQMEMIQESFGRINESYNNDKVADNWMCAIHIKIHSTISDLNTILDIYGQMKSVDQRIIDFHKNIRDYLEKFSKRGFWKKYRALDVDFETKLETISKMY